MPPVRGRKRKSEEQAFSEAVDAHETTDQTVPTKTGSPARTPTYGSPSKRRKVGISLAQKEAFIDQLQMDVTNRARTLRAQYHLQASVLRGRIENRLNRIPQALRVMTMGDLADKVSSGYSYSPRKMAMTARPAPVRERPPPVPAKDFVPARPATQGSTTSVLVTKGPGRPPKRLSDEISGGNKENMDANGPKKRMRASPAPEIAQNPSQVLSPTSANTRIIPRKRVAAPPVAPAAAPPSPVKTSCISRPPSPLKKPSSNNLISNMVEKARSTRAAATTRKATASSTASSSAAPAPAAAAVTRTRRGAAAAAVAATTTTAPAARPPTAMRTTRRVSAISESSDGSTSTVVRKKVGGTAAAAAAPAPAKAPAKRTVMGTIKKGVAGATTRKAAAPKATATAASTATTAGNGRVLRRRG